MKKFIYIFIVVAVLFDAFVNYLGRIGIVFELLPEAMGAMVLVIVAYELANRRPLTVPPRYLVLFSLFLLFLIFGWITNHVNSGAVLGGIRNYFRYMPIFLLPFLYRIDDEDITKILKLILLLAVLQIPVTLYQRFLERGIVSTGDHVTGTLALSSLLSVFLIMCVSVALGCFVQKKLPIIKFAIIIPLLFFPTTINETKGTFFMLPFALLVPSFVYAIKAKKVLQILPVIGVFCVLFFGFIKLYDASIGSQREERDLIGFLTSPEKLKGYLLKEDELEKAWGRFGYTVEVGRLDAINHAYRHITKDITTGFFGYGAGNVSQGINKLTVGEFKKYEQFIPQFTTVSSMLWETGFTGMVFLAVGLVMFWRESNYLVSTGGIVGALALGWTGVLSVYFLALGYKHIMNCGAISILFWFFNGLLVQRAMELRLKQRKDQFNSLGSNSSYEP